MQLFILRCPLLLLVLVAHALDLAVVTLRVPSAAQRYEAAGRCWR